MSGERFDTVLSLCFLGAVAAAYLIDSFVVATFSILGFALFNHQNHPSRNV